MDKTQILNSFKQGYEASLRKLLLDILSENIHMDDMILGLLIAKAAGDYLDSMKNKKGAETALLILNISKTSYEDILDSITSQVLKEYLE